MDIKQNKGLTRNTIDKFYTKDEIVDLCINYINSNIIINLSSLKSAIVL
jgi:hypothetical protein